MVIKLTVVVPKYLCIDTLNIIEFPYSYASKYLHFANSNRFTRNQQRILEQNNQRENANVSE